MLKLVAPRLPRRTPASSLYELCLDGGRSRVLFNDRGKDESFASHSDEQGRFLVTNHLPPAPGAPSDPDTPNSSLCPPFHIHVKEDETFHVISGCAKFLLLDQFHTDASSDADTARDGCIHRMISSRGTVTIPRGQIHTFRNASTAEPLMLEFGFSPPGSEQANDILDAKMKQFFMNTQLYRSDCTIQGVPRAMAQVLLFNYHADVALVPNWLLSMHKRFPRLRSFIERYVSCSLGRLMNFFGGVILGRWLFGMRSTYEEYYSSLWTKSGKHIAEDPSSTSKASDSNNTTAEINTSTQQDGKTDADGIRTDAPAWACQAWRDHSFDSQSDSWRK